MNETPLQEMPIDRTPEVVVQATQDELLSSINAQLNPDTANVAPVASEPTVNAIAPVQNSGQENGTNTAPTPAAAPTTGEQPKVETTPALSNEAKDFLAKKHMTPDDIEKLVKSYQSAEVKLTQLAQENSSLKRTVPQEQPYQQPIAPVSPITGLPYSSVDPNAQLIEDLQNKPIDTMRKIAELSYGPQVNQLMGQLNEQKLHNTIVKLSTSPDTAEFNLPIVQEEIKAIISERPEMGNNLTDNLATLNDLAIGRLYRQGKLSKDAVEAGKKIAEQNITNRQAVNMENAAKPVNSNKTPEQMNLDELRSHLIREISGS